MTEPKVAAVPLAKLKPADWNPRTIREVRFKNLCESIEADPEFLWRRPILATADGTIYAGNMRYRAASHLGMKTVPAIVEDVPERLAKERALRDNAQWGDWQDDQLAEMVYGLAADGADVKLLGIEDDELARLLGIVGVSGDGEASGYTQKIVSPIYEPTGPMPPVTDLYDASRTDVLLAEIEGADLPDDVRRFLRLAAMRHTVLRFDRIANFYAHAPMNVQMLMERSAVVIIDAEQAVELGFLRLHDDVVGAFKADYPDA